MLPERVVAIEPIDFIIQEQRARKREAYYRSFRDSIKMAIATSVAAILFSILLTVPQQVPFLIETIVAGWWITAAVFWAKAIRSSRWV